MDIQRWLPSKWEHVAGNQGLVEHCQDLIHSLRVQGDTNGLNTLVYGPSRMGKTSILKLMIRCLLCEQLDITTLNPCDGTCYPCQQDASRSGLRGLELRGNRPWKHYLPVDCNSVTETELRSLLTELWDYEGIRIAYLDEVYRLHRRGMEEQLLKPIEDRKILWIASSALLDGLDRMFLNRFTMKIKITSPTRNELVVWIATRCIDDFGIQWDHDDTLMILAERCCHTPGLALQVLARASKKRTKPQLTRKLVEEHRFDTEE